MCECRIIIIKDPSGIFQCFLHKIMTLLHAITTELYFTVLTEGNITAVISTVDNPNMSIYRLSQQSGLIHCIRNIV